eukprot:m.417858 g.417858  ORF g.417858 m.417858 type:complete len:227 (+) comp56620_c0_seq38:118-798(+)
MAGCSPFNLASLDSETPCHPAKQPAQSTTDEPDASTTVIGDYRLGKTIGKGNFAKVKLARHLPTDAEVAIKIVDKRTFSAATIERLWREVHVMKMLDHPNVLKLYEVIDTPDTMYLVLEYASGGTMPHLRRHKHSCAREEKKKSDDLFLFCFSSGELFDFLVAHGRMKEKEARLKFRQIVSAVQYCHQKRVVHRGLGERTCPRSFLSIFSNIFLQCGQISRPKTCS